jgi:outer membrane lipoprotein LolB
VTRRRNAGLLPVLLAALILLQACVSAPRATNANYEAVDHWQGRLALVVQGTPPQNFSAQFELRGGSKAGELTFSTALGTTLAELRWGDGFAQLQTTGAPRQFESLDALARETTGADLPIASLFDWLHGRQTPATDWVADLGEIEQGRLHAVRAGPPAPADLKIILSP